MNREELGKFVRKIWINHCKEIGDKKSNHIASWEDISELEREVDRKIGEALIKIAYEELIKHIQKIFKNKNIITKSEILKIINHKKEIVS